MGFSVAHELAAQGADVTLVSGPTEQIVQDPNIKSIKVVSAEEMHQASLQAFQEADITVLSAAVADYKPVIKASDKIKKQQKSMALELTKTVDIAASLGKKKKKSQLIVGFALETTNEIENAKKKIAEKNFDLIVLNSLNDAGAGFGYDTNKISIIDKKGDITAFELKDKKDVAKDIVNKIVSFLHE
jgi:phosphopantothenoylcysteine decarboxylase/phosphopantothenate--cysteine ligase